MSKILVILFTTTLVSFSAFAAENPSSNTTSRQTESAFTYDLPSCSIGASYLMCEGVNNNDGGCSVTCNPGQDPNCQAAHCDGNEILPSTCQCD